MKSLFSATVGPHRNVAAIAAASPKPHEYRAHAAECQEIAAHWPDLLKQQYEELARQWLRLAEQAARAADRQPA